MVATIQASFSHDSIPRRNKEDKTKCTFLQFYQGRKTPRHPENLLYFFFGQKCRVATARFRKGCINEYLTKMNEIPRLK